MPCLSAVETPEVGSSSRMTCGSSAKAEATFEQLLLALRQRRRDRIEPAAQPENVRHLDDPPLDLRVRRKAGQQAPALFLPRHHRGGDRLGHGEARKDRDELKRAREPAIGELHRADPGNAPSHEQDLAGGRLQQPGEQVDQGGLAGPVRPDHRDELAGVEPQAHVLERAQGPERLADIAGLEERRHAALRRSCRRRSSARPARPVGKPITTTARMAPRTKRQYGVSDCSWSCSRM